MSKTRVVISGLLYPMTMLHWFWRAFERRNDIELFVTGPFFGSSIPWNNGMTLPQRYVKQPDLPLPQQSARMNVGSTIVEVQMPEHMRNPDLWIQIDAGWHFNNRPEAGIVALVETDPHVLKSHYQCPKGYSDFVFSMQTPYIESGEFYLPYGYDPEIHQPNPEVEKEYDACLIGLHYNSRSALVSSLQNKGYKVYYSIGEIYDEYRRIYNASKIALSWSSKEDLCARNWEALAMKNLLVANRVPDMSTFFVDGQHYLGFDTLEEAVSKVEWALKNPEEANKIASAGHRKVKHHTWDARVQQLLETMRLR